jgi:hypothetical protein
MVEIMTVEDIAGWDEDLRALTGGLGGCSTGRSRG